MKESTFIENNIKDWKELTSLIQSGSGDPDQIHNLFIKVSGDLSFAQTFYPNRNVRWYLNNLVAQVFDQMRAKTKFSLFTTVRHFYHHTLPKEVVRSKRYFLASLIVFILSFMIGAYSTLQNKDYAKQILGNRYIVMTEQNIADDNPFGVYKNVEQSNMFLNITYNNTRVAFLTFVLGIFAGLGTLIVLINNGIMVGTFQTYFLTKGLLTESLLTIWIHGTIEILSIIIAGASGLILGNHIARPGTFTRMESLKIGARRALIVILSTMPLFVIAGFFEGFVTRLTDIPSFIKLFIILSSLAFMAYVYLYQPWKYAQYNNIVFEENEILEITSTAELESNNEKLSYLKRGFLLFGDNIGNIFSKIIFPMLAVFAIALFFYIQNYFEKLDIVGIDFSPFTFSEESIILLLSDVVTTTIGLYMITSIIYNDHYKDITGSIKDNFIKHLSLFLLLALLVVVPMYLTTDKYSAYIISGLFTMPLCAVSVYNLSYDTQADHTINIIFKSLKMLTTNYFRYLTSIFLLFFIGALIMVFIAIIFSIFKSVISLENLFNDVLLGTFYFEKVLERFMNIMFCCIGIFLIYQNLVSVQNLYFGDDIKEKVRVFANKHLIKDI